jgi:DNA-binding XRE family transcriptional regulator
MTIPSGTVRNVLIFITLCPFLQGGDRRVKALSWRMGMDLRQLFAINLRRLRHERGFTQETLAHDAGIGRAHMSEIERGKVWVGLRIVSKLATVLEAEPAEFFKPPTPRTKRPR